jgi:hypothetical protein
MAGSPRPAQPKINDALNAISLPVEDDVIGSDVSISHLQLVLKLLLAAR